MAAASTKYSRRVYVQTPEMLTEVRVLERWGWRAFRLPEPFFANPGVYRAKLDPDTRTATITEEEAPDA